VPSCLALLRDEVLGRLDSPQWDQAGWRAGRRGGKGKLSPLPPFTPLGALSLAAHPAKITMWIFATD